MAKSSLFFGIQTSNSPALDEDNQSDLTQERIKSWVNQLKQEFGF